MIRRAFVRRMAGAALASGLLGSELLARREEIAPSRTHASDVRIMFDGKDIGGLGLVEWEFWSGETQNAVAAATGVPRRVLFGPST